MGKKVLVFSIALHALLLFLVGGWVINRTTTPSKATFTSAPVEEIPFIEPPPVPEDTTILTEPPTGTGEVDGGNDIQLPPNMLSGASVLPDTLTANAPAPMLLPNTGKSNEIKLGATGFGSGKGSGTGAGDGTGKAGRVVLPTPTTPPGKTMTVGNLEIPEKTVVILDNCPLMQPYLPALQTKIKRQFPRTSILEIESPFGNKKGTFKGLYDVIYTAMEKKPDLEAIYVFSSFMGAYDQADSFELINAMHKRNIKLFINYQDRNVLPYPPLRVYAQVTGGYALYEVKR